MKRSIHKIIPAQKVNMGGIILDQSLPVHGVEQIDPFLLIHHWANKLPGGEREKDLGVGPHPHRGFSPVTLIFKGAVHHRDSLGTKSVIKAGGAQWMNSGKGIVHSERPPKELAEAGGDFELIQFWANTPADRKMEPAKYQPLTAEKTPWITSEDGKVKAGVVAGETLGKTGPIELMTPMLVMRFEIGKDGKMEVPIPKDFNAIFYLLDGKLEVNGERHAGAKDLVWFKNDGESISFEGLEETRAILLAGEPINEPLATYGPFVMNNQTQIMEALRDYQMGKMGVLIEEFDS
ncbi:MAG: pirin family protein [Flavobacteriales bacterium]|nr:pirin family protein [Flavobacteriales bacterium]